MTGHPTPSATSASERSCVYTNTSLTQANENPRETKLDTTVEVSGCLSLTRAPPCQGPMGLAKPSLGPNQSADEQLTFSWSQCVQTLSTTASFFWMTATWNCSPLPPPETSKTRLLVQWFTINSLRFHWYISIRAHGSPKPSFSVYVSVLSSCPRHPSQVSRIQPHGWQSVMALGGRRPRVQGHARLYSELEANLGYEAVSLQQNNDLMPC